MSVEEKLRVIREEIGQLRAHILRVLEAVSTEAFFKAEIYGDIVMGDKTDSSVHISGTVGAFAQSGAVQIITGSINQKIHVSTE